MLTVEAIYIDNVIEYLLQIANISCSSTLNYFLVNFDYLINRFHCFWSHQAVLVFVCLRKNHLK